MVTYHPGSLVPAAKYVAAWNPVLELLHEVLVMRLAPKTEVSLGFLWSRSARCNVSELVGTMNREDQLEEEVRCESQAGGVNVV